MELDFDGESAFRGIRDIFPSSRICYRKLHIHVQDEEPSWPIVAISMKDAEIKEEKIYFTTRQDEVVDMRLLCRENLQLSASSVVLQIRGAIDGDDVGDVAVVKFVTQYSKPRCVRRAVCVGLLLSK